MIPSGQGCRGGMDISIVKIIVFLKKIIAFILHVGFMVIQFSSVQSLSRV